MPYPTRASLPDAVKKLPAHGQDIWRKAFNAAFAAYDPAEHRQPNAEAYGAAVAWAAIRRAGYEKRDDRWVHVGKELSFALDEDGWLSVKKAVRSTGYINEAAKMELIRPILKADEERRMVFGVVMCADDEAVAIWKSAGQPDDGVPDVIDTQGEWVSEATLIRAHERFMDLYAKAMTRGNPLVGERHKRQARGVVMMQSALLPKGICWPDPDSPPLKAALNWVACDRIDNDQLWQDVKDGKITGYSIGGVAAHS